LPASAIKKLCLIGHLLLAAASWASAAELQHIEPLRALKQSGGKWCQPASVKVVHTGAPATVTVRIADSVSQRLELIDGEQTLEVQVPAGAETTAVPVLIEPASGEVLASQNILLKPVPRLMVYLLPHSHTDIGYTEIQTAIEKKQV